MGIKVQGLAEAINRELTIYSQDITDAIKKESQDSVKKLVKKTKETAPVGNRTKHYRDNISSRKLEETDRGATYQWYVKGSDYRLSHLLENGHATRNGGRTRATHFIKNASDPILEEYEKRVEEVCRNGG
jgi:hypothetical protein